jgi:uncharacterized small protein (DUF1192 family)
MNPTGSTALALEIGALKAEIERLKEQLRLAQLENNKLEVAAVDHKAQISALKAEIERLKFLNQEEFGSPTEPSYGVKGPVHELIAELRRAAE